MEPIGWGPAHEPVSFSIIYVRSTLQRFRLRNEPRAVEDSDDECALYVLPFARDTLIEFLQFQFIVLQFEQLRWRF